MAKSLTENRKKQLDGIVERMIRENRPDKEIQSVVDDFKSIHSKGFFGNLAREAVLPIKKGIQSLRATGDIARGESFLEATESRKDSFVGPVSPLGVQGERGVQSMRARGVKPTGKQVFGAYAKDAGESIGAGLEIGSNLPIGNVLGTTTKIGTQVAKQGLKQYATRQGARRLGRQALNMGIESSAGAGMYTLGRGIQEQTPVGQLAKDTAISTAIGFGAGAILGAGGAVAGTGLRQGFRGIKDIGNQTNRIRGAIGTPSKALEQREISKLEKNFDTLFDEKKSTIRKNDVLSRFGQSPSRIFAEAGYIPKIEGNKIRTDDFIESSTNFISENAQGIQKVLDAYENVNPRSALSYADFRTQVLKNVESNPDFAGKVTQLTNKLDEFLKDYRTAIKKDKLGVGQLNRLRVQSNINTKKYKFTDPDKGLVDDLDNVVGDTVRRIMAEKNISPTINQINQEIGKLIKARAMARYINGNTINGGALTNMLVSLGAGSVTAVVTGGQSAVVRGLLSVISAFGAKEVLNTIRSMKFGGIIRKRILRNIGLNKEVMNKLLKELPEIERRGLMREIQDALRETPQLPAPKTGTPQIRVESGKTIELPSRSQSTVDAEEMTRVQGQIKKPKLSLKDQGGFIAGSFKNEGDLTTKILKDLEGKTTVSKQYILDATNRGELKQVERDITRQVLDTMEGDTINVKEFADKVKSELLPLKVKSSDVMKPNPKHPYPIYQEEGAYYPKYESIALPEDLRGPVKNYRENIYESPIETSAGKTHFDYTTKNYFGHTRIEDMADNKTRRVIEVQSDLYQKGNLEKEGMVKLSGLTDSQYAEMNKIKGIDEKNAYIKSIQGNLKDKVSKLQQYNDPTAHFRMIREEIKKASQDGKTKLQFPTGETALKIEWLGQGNTWHLGYNQERGGGIRLTTDALKVGEEVVQGSDKWIITDVLGDGKFKAVPKDKYDEIIGDGPNSRRVRDTWVEEFDISGKVDTNNPIYKFYEKDVQKYLNKFGGKRVVDDKGVSWIEIPITKEQGISPVEAFGKIKVSPLVAGAVTGTAGVVVAGAINKKKKQ